MKGRTNLWTQGPAKQQQYQIDVQTIEELFGQKDCQSNGKATPTRGGKTRTSFRETKEEVCILDRKRGMNIGIFLKQFKRSNQMIMEDIQSGNSEPYGAEPLRDLLKLLPETDEVEKLKAFRGDVSKLSLADSFVYLLIQLPSYVVRIESMLLTEEFPAECEAMKRDIKTLRSATKELKGCEELHAVLHLVLQAGNILNAGGYAGNAVGFKLSSLPALADTKANKPGMNLLHFVALEAQKKDEKLLEFPLKLRHVQAASRISLDTLDTELQRLTARTQSVEESVQRDAELLQQLDTFLQSATSALCSLRNGRQQLKREAEELLDFFCEDKDTFKLDDCFNIFNSFCLKFTAAVKDNAERERKEAVRQRRLQELEEQKRHSWAGEQTGGAFGLRCSSEADMNPAVSRHDEAGLLMELLMPKTHPRSPLLRHSGSFRRLRNAESEARTTEQKDAEKPSLQNALNATTDYLWHNSRRDKTERQAKTFKSTSDIEEQQPDLNNNGKETESKKNELNQDFCSKINEKSVNMSVFVKKCTLVPELKVFNQVSLPTKSKNKTDVVITDVEEQEANDFKQTEKTASLVKAEEGSRDTVVVWCVTGVCEAENSQTDHSESDNHREISFTADNDTPLDQQKANQKSVPEPISSQPLPVSRSPDLTASAFEMKTDCQTKDNEVSINKNEEIVGQMRDNKQERQGNVLEKEVNDQEKYEKVSENLKACQNAKSKKVPSSKATTANKSKPVRTLTKTENLNMRRVVPISRPLSGKVPDKPPGIQRGSSAVSIPNRNAPRQVERPSTAPTSRRSSINKTEVQELHDVNRKTFVRKPPEKKTKMQQEEKICRSTLRAISQNEERGIGIVSAPTTPIHKATSPGFARNTASSSFRRTNTTLANPQNSTKNNINSSQNLGNLSPKVSSPKTLSPRLSRSSNSANLALANPQHSTTNDVACSQKVGNGYSSKISSSKLSSSSNLRNTTVQNSANSNLATTKSVANAAKISALKIPPPCSLAKSLSRNSSNSSLASLKMSTLSINATLQNSTTIGPDQNLGNGSPNISSTNSNLTSKMSSSTTTASPNSTNHNSGASAENSTNSSFQKSSPSSFTSLSSQNSTNNNAVLSQDSASAYFTDSNTSGKSTNLVQISSVTSSLTNVAATSSPSNLIKEISQNLSNNNLASSDFTDSDSSEKSTNSAKSPKVSSLSGLNDQISQNSSNNNLTSAQELANASLSNFKDTNSSEKSTNLSPKMFSWSSLTNSASSVHSANVSPKVLSPNVSSRSTLRKESSGNSRNNPNLSPTRNSSPKMSDSSLTRASSLRVLSFPITPDLGLKRSPSVRASFTVDARGTTAAASQTNPLSPKESRPTWR